MLLFFCGCAQAAQIQLDRAAQDFRQLHQERQDLIRQWDEARDAMKSRDEAIQVGHAASWVSATDVCSCCLGYSSKPSRQHILIPLLAGVAA